MAYNRTLLKLYASTFAWSRGYLYFWDSFRSFIKFAGFVSLCGEASLVSAIPGAVLFLLYSSVTCMFTAAAVGISLLKSRVAWKGRKGAEMVVEVTSLATLRAIFATS